LKTVGIIGCGWLGERIADSICGDYSIRSTTTSQEKFARLYEKGFNPSIASFPDDVDMPGPPLWKEARGLDIVIITVPFSDRNSTCSSQSVKVANLSSFLGDFKGQMFFMSSTGVYPDIPKEVTEDELPLEDVCAERLIKNVYPQVNILRLAGLMGGTRQLRNYKVSNLDLPVNHIHYADVCAAVRKMIELRSSSQLYNVVAPMHPTKAEVISGEKGENYMDDVSLVGKIISCRKLISALNYQFRYPDPRLFDM
jgi:hypothetical protein